MAGRAPQPLTLKVHGKRLVAERVVELRLDAADGAPLPTWEPGAHVELLLPGGLARHYSLCGDPADRATWRLGVLREERGHGGSAHLHDRLMQGDLLQASGPRNHFALQPGERRTVFIAGGIGITPILPMISRVSADRRDWRLVYGGRRRASMAFLDELVPHGDAVVIVPQDERGPIDLDDALADLTNSDAVYCCGPEGLLAAVEGRFGAGLPGRLHVERFKAAAGVLVVDKPFEAVLRRSGRTVRVPAGTSLLEALNHAGLDLPSSCREGVCGTCEIAVLGGRPDHRDQVLSVSERAANRTMIACVSRSLDERIELDA